MKNNAGKGTVQRPDLSEVHGTDPTEETHREGEHRPEEDAPGGNYKGEHGQSLPRKDSGKER